MPRPGVVNVAFAVVFGLVAVFAAVTAAGTTGSWFSVEVSSLVFQTSIFAAIATAMPQGETSVAGTLVEISAALQATRTRKEVLRVLIRERVRVESDRTRVAGTVAGPIVMALLFAGMAGAMLPGVQGFAQTNFQLTTGVVLFLAYGLAFLVAWALAALVSLVRRAPEPRNGDWPEPKPKLIRTRRAL